MNTFLDESPYEMYIFAICMLSFSRVPDYIVWTVWEGKHLEGIYKHWTISGSLLVGGGQHIFYQCDHFRWVGQHVSEMTHGNLMAIPTAL